MRTLLKSLLLTASLAAALGAASASSAETAWGQHHPRRAEVNHRLANQERRIRHEVRTGHLTRGQARHLRAEDRGIRGQERYDASRDGGHITRVEQRRLNREENGVSRQIRN
jgi:hypothetical protein